MYLRKKKNRSGSTGVVVVSKKSGRYEEVKSCGASTNPEEINQLYRQATEWAHPKCGRLEIEFDDSKRCECEETRRVIDNMASVLINGSQILLNCIYDNICFNRIPDEILHYLVIASVSQPASKLATVAYLKSYYDDVDLSAIYRHMDRLYNTQMELALQSGRLTKENVNRRGYNKFLEISKDVDVTIVEDKITEDSRWDGLKGYVTNTDLDTRSVIAQYHGLWVVERAFRVSKGKLETRPIFHFTERRIEAHICICFIAYKVYKELERLISVNRIGMSVDKVLDVAKTIVTVMVDMPQNGEIYTKTLFLTEGHQRIKPLFDMNDDEK